MDYGLLFVWNKRFCLCSRYKYYKYVVTSTDTCFSHLKTSVVELKLVGRIVSVHSQLGNPTR